MAPAAGIGPCSPFFIVSDIAASLDHYVGRLGFECAFQAPEPAPFFAIVRREAAQIMLKAIGDDVPPLPNHARHPWAAWDTFIFAAEPAALAEAFAGAGVEFHRPLENTDDGLFGFAVADPDGYVSFFGRPA